MQLPVVKKVNVSLGFSESCVLKQAVLNEKTLDQSWICERGWGACYIEDAELTKFTATALIRYCRNLKLEYIFAVDTIDLFQSNGGNLELRKIPVSLDGISQACFGFPRMFESNPDYDWMLIKAWGASLFFSTVKEPKFLVLRDASGCTTIAGETSFLQCMSRRSKRTWYQGIPFNGNAVSGGLVPYRA